MAVLAAVLLHIFLSNLSREREGRNPHLRYFIDLPGAYGQRHRKRTTQSPSDHSRWMQRFLSAHWEPHPLPSPFTRTFAFESMKESGNRTGRLFPVEMKADVFPVIPVFVQRFPFHQLLSPQPCKPHKEPLGATPLSGVTNQMFGKVGPALHDCAGSNDWCQDSSKETVRGCRCPDDDSWNHLTTFGWASAI